MAVSRSESLQSQYGRRRSNTAQSVMRPTPPTPLAFGDSKVLNSWVHDAKESSAVIFNQVWWPVSRTNSDGSAAFLFMVPKDEGCTKPQLQISIPKPVADTFGLRNNGDVTVTKINKDEWCADYVELIFQDQYLGRNDMWQVTFIGSVAAKIQCIYVGGKKVSSACMTSSTKAIYRSLSAKVTIFIQVCRELWEFSGDGERYNEKIVHSFLPALFSRWRDAGTNHTVTIVLISRVFYDESEISYAAGPLRRDEDERSYKDFYKVITDLEVMHEWKPTLVSLKDSFWDFQRDILLTHHYHRASQDSAIGSAEQVRLIGRLSYAHDGPVLEALNLSLNPTETHYIDRSLSLTGATTLMITPGTGYFKVSKSLLRLTTTRMLDQGFGLDLISLAKKPLHQSPIFSFQGFQTESRGDVDNKGIPISDPLWGGDEETARAGQTKTTLWWEPFWISMTFWDKQMDLPFREDRFIARAKMHEIQMLGLLEHDVLSSIEVPFLPERDEPFTTNILENIVDDSKLTKTEVEKFDQDTFTLKTEAKLLSANRNSFVSAPNGTTSSTTYRTLEKRGTGSHRNSVIASRIAPIEESPKRIILELPPEGPPDSVLSTPTFSGLSSSPSQSIRSLRSNRSTSSSLVSSRPRESGSTRSSIASKLTPSWLFHPFRSGPSEPQTSQVSASASPSRTPVATPITPPVTSPIRMPPVSKPTVAQTNPPLPMAIKNAPNRSNLSRTFEEEGHMPHRSLARPSPINTPPRDDTTFGKRRSITLAPPVSSSPVSPPNPSQPRNSIPYAQSSLARRWQHMFPQVLYKYDIKWKSIVTPGCLPLTVEHFPTSTELESSYDVFSYDFVIDPGEMRSFLVKPPAYKIDTDGMRRSWALVVMRGMAAVRLAQGFQFVLRPNKNSGPREERPPKPVRKQSFMTEDDLTPKPGGAADILRSTDDPVYLSMTNEIHRISYTGEAIQVRRYVRRMRPTRPFSYECLIWPKLGVGYTELSTTFSSHGLENYGWNRLDMLVAGYENNFNESLRYWRTRFIVIPTIEPPPLGIGPSGERLNEEESRILGIEKLAEQFTKLRWQPPDEKANHPAPPVRFLPTTLDPALSVLDEALMEQLDQIHEAELRKKMKSEREIADTPLATIAKLMREEGGVPIKHYQWHRSQYPNSFTGFDVVSWLVREFRDVSSRSQATEWGVKLQEQGLFEHCREYSVPMTPKGWFRRHATDDINPRSGYYPSSVARTKNSSPRRNKKRLILSQTMIIDIDPNKKSDQAESVVLHHDIIHNPATVFHFELQWIGTTARCIEDQLRQWSRTIERYGLKLVEAYVTQISDIRDRNGFQSCFPLRLAVPPPIVSNIEKRVPEGTQTARYFEYALLRRFNFILDVEAADLYPEQIDVVYSYRRSPYKYSQFVHRSGVAFVQILGGERGFLFLTNRLMGSGRLGNTMKNKDQRPSATAEDVRTKLQQFCADRESLNKFYDEELAMLGHAPEEPPPLSI
ncbi:hypothetical protein BD779DRAFT_1514381 [Infundibulicybe gibba]|nr:hypothetical protein BD779DRAFT_1514381 [Infundibulicybe gibba]